MGGRGSSSGNNLSLGKYIKHKGEPKYEIAWRKQKIKQINNNKTIKDDPTGEYRERLEKQIREWENRK